MIYYSSRVIVKDASYLNLILLYCNWQEKLMSYLNLSLQNEKALAKADDAARHALLKDADKYCKVLLGQLSQGHGCLKSMIVLSVVLAVGAVFMSQNLHLWDYSQLTEMLNLSQDESYPVICSVLMPSVDHFSQQ